MVRTMFDSVALETAVEANMVEFLETLAHLPGVAYAEEPNYIRFVSGIPHPLFNTIMGARLRADVDAAIDQALQHFTSRGLPMGWYIGSSTQPLDLGARLEAHGLTHLEDMPGMAVDLLALGASLLCPAGLAIECVEDRGGLAQWLRTLSVGFELPAAVADGFGELLAGVDFGSDARFQHYLGLLEGEPVACSTLVLGNQVAGIYNVATIPEVRRQGIGTAITLAPLRAAQALGYRYAVLFASKMGYGIYQRMGFRDCCTLGLYVLNDGTDV